MLDSLLPSNAHRSLLERATAKYEENVDDLASFLGARGIGRAAATGQRLGLVCEPEPGHERFVGFMSIPYVTKGGVVSMKFRRLEGDGPKYDSPPGQQAHLYGVSTLLDPLADTVLVCEGELDALAAHAQLGVPAVGTPGTTWLDHWPRCLADFDRVLIIADNDLKDDGSNPGVKHAKKVQGSISESRIVLPPAGLDMTDWLLRDGAESVAKEIGL